MRMRIFLLLYLVMLQLVMATSTIKPINIDDVISVEDNSNAVSTKTSGAKDNSNNIYQDKDNDGNIIITNKPKHLAAQKINLPALIIAEKPMTQADININNNSNGGNRTIDTNNNQLGREYVLREELSKEVTALHEAMSALDYNKRLPIDATDVKHQEQIKIIEDAIHEHQKNIALLNSTLK